MTAIQSVLVTAVGGILAQGIIKSLKLANHSVQPNNNDDLKYEITGTDTTALATGLYRCDHAKLLPPAASSDYVDALVDVCKKQGIKGIFVGSDDELLAMAQAKDKIERNTNAKVLVGDHKIISLCRDKWHVFEFCKKRNLLHATTTLPADKEALITEFGFPVVVKPREGYGSVHFYLARDRDQLDFAVSAIIDHGWHPILQEHLDGDEFTTGVTISQRTGNVMSSVASKKILKHGQTYKAFIDDFVDVRTFAEHCAKQTTIRGPVNIQTKLVNDKPIIFEFNPRFSASCPMRAAAGINEPDIVYRNFVLGEEPKFTHYDNLVCMRYWNEVYIPGHKFKPLLSETKQGKADLDCPSTIHDYF